jgi:hypothetical protein
MDPYRLAMRAVAIWPVPDQRGAFLHGCVEVIEQARNAPGCLDFALTADLLTAGRINVFERWESAAAVQSFRGDGPQSTAAGGNDLRLRVGIRRLGRPGSDVSEPAAI